MKTNEMNLFQSLRQMILESTSAEIKEVLWAKLPSRFIQV